MWRIGGRFAVDLWRFGQPDGDFGCCLGEWREKLSTKMRQMGKVAGVDPAAGGGGGFGRGRALAGGRGVDGEHLAGGDGGRIGDRGYDAPLYLEEEVMGMGHSVRHVLAALAFARGACFFLRAAGPGAGHSGRGVLRNVLAEQGEGGERAGGAGKILDRNGKVLVRDEVRWTAVVAEGAPEESRTRLAQLCRRKACAGTARAR